MKNAIALRYGFVTLPTNDQSNLRLAMSVNHQLMTYGYMLDETAFEQVSKADEADIIEFHDEVVTFLKEMTGGKHNFVSLYGNFPNDVMSKTRYELFVDQINHYWGKKTFDPAGLPKEVAFEHVEYKMLTDGDDAKFMQIFTDLCSVNQSLTPTDSMVLYWFAKSGLELVYPDTIPFKENLSILATTLPKFTVKTVVDVLRVAVAFSGGDVSLPALPKRPKSSRVTDRRDAFRFKMTVEQKQRVLELFEGSNLDVRDMNQGRKYGRFIRLFEVLGHIDSKVYPKTAKAVYQLRNQKRKGKPDGENKIRTWYSLVNQAFTSNNVERGLELLKQRPAEFLRKLDWLVRTYTNSTDKILATLNEVGVNSSNKVLYEVYTHFEGRNKEKQRSVMIKGNRSRTNLSSLPALKQDLIDTIQDSVILTLKEKFSKLPEMGKCYIDPELQKIPLPTNMRSLSESLVPVIRGQRIPFGTGKKVVRPFIHWYDEQGNQDLDMHGFLIGDGKSLQFGFNGSYNEDFGCFSGDVRHRIGACAEYVDINVEKTVSEGYKYFIQVVHNFTGRPLHTLKDCVAGVMERENALKNSAWVPDTVKQCMKLTSESTYCLVGVYDLETREYIHLDLDWITFSGCVNNGSSNKLFDAIAPYIANPKLSVYDLIRWHVESRGQMVGVENAETVFTYDDFKYSYVETMKYMGI